MNKTFLVKNGVKLVVDTAPSLQSLMGPKYSRQKQMIQSEFQVLSLDWEDTTAQLIDPSQLKAVILAMERTFCQGTHTGPDSN